MHTIGPQVPFVKAFMSLKARIKLLDLRPKVDVTQFQGRNIVQSSVICSAWKIYYKAPVYQKTQTSRSEIWNLMVTFQSHHVEEERFPLRLSLSFLMNGLNGFQGRTT